MINKKKNLALRSVEILTPCCPLHSTYSDSAIYILQYEQNTMYNTMLFKVHYTVCLPMFQTSASYFNFTKFALKSGLWLWHTGSMLSVIIKLSLETLTVLFHDQTLKKHHQFTEKKFRTSKWKNLIFICYFMESYVIGWGSRCVTVLICQTVIKLGFCIMISLQMIQQFLEVDKRRSTWQTV